MFKRKSVLKAMFALFAVGQVINILADDQDLDKTPSLAAVALGLALVGATCAIDEMKAALGIAPLL